MSRSDGPSAPIPGAPPDTEPLGVSRRGALAALTALLAGPALGACGAEPSAREAAPAGRDLANFRAVYGEAERRAEFTPFLRNVFHLYPEDELDRLIADAVTADPRDPAVYRRLAAGLDSISPPLAALRYALPALRRQKDEMTRQTTRLLGEGSRFRGYLEIGSHGRYLDGLEETLVVEGPIYTTAPVRSGYSPEDVVDRGQLARVGRELPWSDYAPLPEAELAPGSLGLITVYIGLHHSRDEQREGYVRSLYRALAPGGKLVVRDHDVSDERMRHLVSLAHDVFNVGTREPWTANESERRNFYPLDELIGLMERVGFRPSPERLLQDGDPTRNTLLCFTKA